MSTPAKSLPLAKAVDRQQPRDSDSVSHAVGGKVTHELVLAVAGLAGAGPSHIAQKLQEELRRKGFTPIYLRLSDLLKSAARIKGIPVDEGAAHVRTASLQRAGGVLRKSLGGEVVAGLAIREISRARNGLVGTPAFILDQLKHPDELELLRQVYKSSFHLLGVVCHDDIRFGRLKLKYKDAETNAVNDIKSLDEADPEEEGQQVRRLLHLADFFVSNDQDASTGTADLVADALSRFTRLVTGRGVERPSRDDVGMYAAWGASLKSSCLSRQVGAAIIDPAGNIISTGTNEVPKAHGGIYGPESETVEEHDAEAGPPVPTGRCYHWEICFNDRKKGEIYNEIISKLEPFLAKEASRDAARAALKATRVGSLIEFSRAVHAEMDAIVSLARRGSSSSQDATLFCRTYPCHSCARHIVAAGIREVVYIEPYKKSLAAELHADSIVETTVPAGESAKKVHFRLFTGVAPRRFAALFEEKRDLKEGAEENDTPHHRNFIHSVSHLEFEKLIADKIDKVVPTGEGQSG